MRDTIVSLYVGSLSPVAVLLRSSPPANVTVRRRYEGQKRRARRDWIEHLPQFVYAKGPRYALMDGENAGAEACAVEPGPGFGVVESPDQARGSSLNCCVLVGVCFRWIEWAIRRLSLLLAATC